MIYLKELIKESMYPFIPMDHKFNLMQLHYRLNVLRHHFGEPMVVNSGYRTEANHMEIYNEINDRRAVQGLRAIKVPWGSQHLIGAAADIQDRDKKLKHFIEDNEHLLTELGLYCEDFEVTENFVHFQIFPPKSGKRFFKP